MRKCDGISGSAMDIWVSKTGRIRPNHIANPPACAAACSTADNAVSFGDGWAHAQPAELACFDPRPAFRWSPLMSARAGEIVWTIHGGWEYSDVDFSSADRRGCPDERRRTCFGTSSTDGGAPAAGRNSVCC